jgi:hypothetical protein
MFKNEFINFQDRLFLIKRIIKEEHQPNVEVWKDHLMADTVLKKDGLFYFLETVPDLEIINDL